MNMKRTLLSWTFASAALFAIAAAAGDRPLIFCDGCSPYTMAYRAMVQAGGAGKKAWVGDMTTRTVHQYVVARYPDPDNCDPGMTCFRLEGVEQPLDAGMLEAFQAGLRFYDAAPVGWHKKTYYQLVQDASSQSAPAGTEVTYAMLADGSRARLLPNVTVPGEILYYRHPGKNSYSMATPGQDQQTLLSWADGQAVVKAFDALTDVAQAVAMINFANPTQIPTMEWVIQFDDGSSLSIIRDTTTSITKGRIDPTSLLDSNGNPIPYTYKDLENGADYAFGKPGSNPRDPADMGSRISTIGGTMVIGGSNVQGIHCGTARVGNAVTVTCTTY